MTETVQVQDPRLSRDDFAAMLDEQFGSNSRLEGTVVKGTVVDIDNDEVVVDVGLKSEGRVPLKEFGTHGQPPERDHRHRGKHHAGDDEGHGLPAVAGGTPRRATTRTRA